MEQAKREFDKAMPQDPKKERRDLFSGLALGEISASSLLGVCAGFYLKRTSEEIAYYLGMGVIAFQLLAYFGYVTVNWRKVPFSLLIPFLFLSSLKDSDVYPSNLT